MRIFPVGRDAVLVEVTSPADAVSLAALARGYPVVAVVEPTGVWQCAQLRPAERVRFRTSPASARH